VKSTGWWVAVLGVGLAGCFSLKQPPLKIEQFRLEYAAEAPQGMPLPLILRVPSMEVAATYDRDPIVYREGDYSIGSYFYFRWASNPGNMIADLLARDLAASGLYRDVQTAVSMVSPDFQVKGTVEEIEELVASHDCSARLRLRITLAAARGPHAQRVRFSKLYAEGETCRCDDPASVAESMSRAMARISAAIQADVYSSLATP
jgi:ABC-type uncharacterized transport system auxiliary subunit